MKSFTRDNWPKLLQKYLIKKKMLRRGSGWGSSFRKKKISKNKNHNMRLSGIMPRPKSYKSSINLFGKKYDSALIAQKQQSIVGKSLHPHCFVTCLRNKVCGRAVWNGEPASGEENRRLLRHCCVLVAPHWRNVRLC